MHLVCSNEGEITSCDCNEARLYLFGFRYAKPVGIRGSWAEMKKLMGARWARAHDFSKKLMGGKIRKRQWAHNRRLNKILNFVLKKL